MAISYRPKIGEVLECNFGQFKRLDNGETDNRNFDGRIPPEIVKKRLAVVLNGKLNGGCLVVPISSSQDLGGISQGHHVEISPDLFKITDFYDSRERWAKCELIQQVSRERLYKLWDNGTRFDTFLPRDMVEMIQRAVIKSISATSLINR